MPIVMMNVSREDEPEQTCPRIACDHCRKVISSVGDDNGGTAPAWLDVDIDMGNQRYKANVLYWFHSACLEELEQKTGTHWDTQSIPATLAYLVNYLKIDWAKAQEEAAHQAGE